jgi:hypothetical protein
MRLWKTQSLILVFLCFSSGCAKDGLDGSSEEAFRKSAAGMRAALTGANQERFSKVMEGFEYLAGENALSVFDDSTRVMERVRKRLDGLTAEEVFALWEEKIVEAIEELEKKKERTEAAMAQLKDVTVLKSRYYVQRGQHVVELTIKNATEHTVHRVYFQGELRTPDRRRPWVEDDFNYHIPGGLEPGKSATWNFALLSPVWDKAPADRDDLSLRVIVVRIDGEDNQPVYDAFSNRFSRRDAERLKKLKEYQEAIHQVTPSMTTS